MPSGDKMGPRGVGSRTGRGFGYCAGYDTPGYTKGPGMGLGRGGGRGCGVGYGRNFGYGRGHGWGYRPSISTPVYNPYSNEFIPKPTPENQLIMLKQEKEYLESQVDGIHNSIADISKKIEELEKNE